MYVDYSTYIYIQLKYSSRSIHLITSRSYILHLGNDGRSGASGREEEVHYSSRYRGESEPGKDSLGGRMCPLWWLSCVLDAVNPDDTATTRGRPSRAVLSTVSMQIFSCATPARYNSPLFANTVENQCRMNPAVYVPRNTQCIPRVGSALCKSVREC